MHIALAALFAFAILTLWVPAVWPVTVFEVGAYLLCAVALWRRPPARFSWPIVPFAFAIAWGLLQLALHWTLYPFDTRVALLRWTAFLATFLTAWCLFADHAIRRWFRLAMLWFAFVVSVWAILQTFTAEGKVLWLFETGYPTAMGPILSQNHFAAFVEVVLPIACYRALRAGRQSGLYSLMAATLYASVVASASRAGTVLATAEVLTVVALMAARGQLSGRTVANAAARAVVLFAVFTLVVGWTHVWDRFWAPDPMNSRREFNQASLHMIAAHPVTGVGLGAWPTVYPRYAVVDIGLFANQAHNDWLQFTAEGGLPLGLLMLSLFLWCLRPAFQTIWGIGVLAVFCHALVDYPFSRPALGAWPILIIAMLAHPDRR